MLASIVLLVGCKSEEPVSKEANEANMGKIEADGAAAEPLPEEK